MTRLDILMRIAAAAVVHVGLAGATPSTEPAAVDAARAAEPAPRCIEEDEAAPFILDPLPPLRVADIGDGARA